MTSLSGLPAYVDMAEVSGLVESVRTHMIVREGGQGWTDAQMVMSLLLLNIAGGECVDDPRSSRGQALRVLEKDEGLGRVLRSAETHRMHRGERRAHQRRWRKQRQRSVPSPSAVFRYLGEFHDASEEDRRRLHKAFIPQANDALRGLGKVNADMVGFVQRQMQHTRATLDMDATLIETCKTEAMYCYNKYPAYQPLTTYWYEADLIVHSEFRDGNVPAGHDQLRVLRESLQYLPAGVEQVLLRSDTAGYQWELLRYCAEGRDERFGANAAWWAIVVLAFNLNSAMKQLALGGDWKRKRLKAVRFGIICLPGRVVQHARRLIIRLARGHPHMSCWSMHAGGYLLWQMHRP